MVERLPLPDASDDKDAVLARCAAEAASAARWAARARGSGRPAHRRRPGPQQQAHRPDRRGLAGRGGFQRPARGGGLAARRRSLGGHDSGDAPGGRRPGFTGRRRHRTLATRRRSWASRRRRTAPATRLPTPGAVSPVDYCLIASRNPASAPVIDEWRRQSGAHVDGPRGGSTSGSSWSRSSRSRPIHRCRADPASWLASSERWRWRTRGAMASW